MEFIEDIIQSEVPIVLFLKNGIKLNGLITEQNEAYLLLSGQGTIQLVFMGAIATIMPVPIRN